MHRSMLSRSPSRLGRRRRRAAAGQRRAGGDASDAEKEGVGGVERGQRDWIMKQSKRKGAKK